MKMYRAFQSLFLKFIHSGLGITFFILFTQMEKFAKEIVLKEVDTDIIFSRISQPHDGHRDVSPAENKFRHSNVQYRALQGKCKGSS